MWSDGLDTKTKNSKILSASVNGIPGQMRTRSSVLPNKSKKWYLMYKLKASVHPGLLSFCKGFKNSKIFQLPCSRLVVNTGEGNCLPARQPGLDAIPTAGV